MEHASRGDEGGPEHVDATHITGDLWFINRYGSGWYMAAFMVSIFTAGFGLPLLAYLLWKSVHTGDEPPEVYARN